MWQRLARRLLGTRNERLLKAAWRQVAAINAQAEDFRVLDEAALDAAIDDLSERSGEGINEALALCREVARRTLGLTPFDEQLIGALALHKGRIAEMKTGEGKTLVAPLAAALHAFAGRRVDIVTVNDYLARRDVAAMAPFFARLGLDTASITHEMVADERREAYQADVVYATATELGFDFLRDNLAMDPGEQVRRERPVAIVDEVDSVLIDEARTPMVISGAVKPRPGLCRAVNSLARAFYAQVREGEHFTLERTLGQVHLTTAGQDLMEELLGRGTLLGEGESLYDADKLQLLNHLDAALRAHKLFRRDVDYLVNDGAVEVIDAQTGRTMPGRRWSEGLHQAVEAKEGVEIRPDSRVLASISPQNFFRGYEHLSGMTGTADTEAREFIEIYGLEVMVIPTHRPVIRVDHNDRVYRTREAKAAAIVAAIKDCHGRGQPVLVGTTSVAESEALSRILAERDIAHTVLNAKNHAREAAIIAEAGRLGAVTVATNMAGRGTDIVLGGNAEADIAAEGLDPDSAEAQARFVERDREREQVIAAGGLHVIGSERHEARRIDNQLRGRAGRQGDPGSSRFYLAPQDPLLKRFGEARITAVLNRLEVPEAGAIEHRLVSRVVEDAQRRREGERFAERKRLVEFDDIQNAQRRVVYDHRSAILHGDDTEARLAGMIERVVASLVESHLPDNVVEDLWSPHQLADELRQLFSLELDIAGALQGDGELDPAGVERWVAESAQAQHERGRERITARGGDPERFTRRVILKTLDDLWSEHLEAMEILRRGIGFRALAQRNPQQEFRKEAFRQFEAMLDAAEAEAVRRWIQATDSVHGWASNSRDGEL